MRNDQLVIIKDDPQSTDFDCLGRIKIITGKIYVTDIKTGREMGPFKESQLVTCRKLEGE